MMTDTTHADNDAASKWLADTNGLSLRQGETLAAAFATHAKAAADQRQAEIVAWLRQTAGFHRSYDLLTANAIESGAWKDDS